MAGTGPICPICGKAHVSCGGPSAAAPIALVVQESGAMGGELETITLTSGRVTRVNARDKARYARRGLIASGQESAPEEEAPKSAPKTVALPKRQPRKKAQRPVEDKAVSPDEDKAEG